MSDSILNSNMRFKFYSLYNVSHGGHSTIVPLEGLRALAAFMVFVVHYAAQFTPWIDTNSLTWDLIVYYRHVGAKGVELFFIISGFLIYGMLIRKDEPFLTYLKRRIHRIYPTFLVVLAIYIGLSFIFPNESKLPQPILESLDYILLNILLIPGFFDIPPIITVSWSLSYEMFFYISVPLILFLLKFKKWKSIERITFLSIVSLFGFVLIHLGYDSYSKIMCFVSGMILYEIHLSKEICQKLSFKYILPISFLVLIVVRYMNLPYIFELLTLFIGFNLLCVACFNNKTHLSQFFSSSILRCYGNMSYSYYLIHGLTLKFLFFILNQFVPANHQWDWALYFLIIPVFIITWFTSTGLFILVEKPLSLAKKNKTISVTQGS